MSFLQRIDECNTYDPGRFRPFRVGDAEVGHIRRDLAPSVLAFDAVFEERGEAIALAGRLTDFAERSEAVDGVLRRLAEQGRIGGWRGEMYPVTTAYLAPPLLQIERAAAPLFGIRCYGVMVNGFVRDGRDGGDIAIWVGRRSRSKPTWPGMLDVFVGGGQPIGVGLMDNLVKEAAEEAALPAALAGRARQVGAITYRMETQEGLRPDVEFNFDLELPADFQPRNTDGEIEEFYLWPAARVIEIVRETREFKPNCSLAMIDFFIRHGLLTPDEPDYLEILRGLRR